MKYKVRDFQEIFHLRSSLNQVFLIWSLGMGSKVHELYAKLYAKFFPENFFFWEKGPQFL